MPLARRLSTVALAAALAATATAPASAADVVSCKEERVAGLEYRGSQWQPSTFKLERFLLQFDGVRAWYQAGQQRMLFSCTQSGYAGVVAPFLFCSSPTFAASLTYNPRDGRGSLTRQLGSVLTGADRDSLLVTAFSCLRS